MTILFDIGATHLRLARKDGKGIADEKRLDTPADAREAVRLFAQETRAYGDAERAVGGVPAIIADGRVVSATNLPAWTGFPFADELSKLLEAPVFVRNDAELAGLAEAREGAGKGAERVAYIGIGTGVGVAFVAGGAVVPHASDDGRTAVIALSDGTSLEERIGGRALRARYGTAPESLPSEAWDELTPYLIEGVRNAIRLWRPDAVVLGGSLVAHGDAFRVERIAAAFEGAEAPSIRKGTLGDRAGLMGASCWADAI